MTPPDFPTQLGRVLIAIGVIVLATGLALVFRERLPLLGKLLGWLGRLPGDIAVERENFRFYFPVVTSLVVSIVLTVLFNIFRK